MTDEEIVAALAEALDDTATGLWMNQDAARQGDRTWGRVVAVALLPVVRRVAEQRAAEVATETATKWQYSAWIDLPGQVEQRLASAQFVTEWLRARARAAALTATPNHGTDPT